MDTLKFYLGQRVEIAHEAALYRTFHPGGTGEPLVGVVCNIDVYFGNLMGYYVRLPESLKHGDWFSEKELSPAHDAAPGNPAPITRERWQQMSLADQWQYFSALQWLYNHPDEEPPIEEGDTGALRVYNELTGNFDGEPPQY